VREIKEWRLIWNSEGSGARSNVTIWEPIHQFQLFKQNVMSVNLGFYACSGYQQNFFQIQKPPASLQGFTIELTDTNVTGLSKSRNLNERYINYIFPHPVQFKLAWNLRGGVHIWKAIPPTNNYVSLGIVATISSREPLLSSLRCVHKGLVTRTSWKPVKIWDNSGTSGKKGSLWVINSLGMVGTTEGYEEPTGEFYDIRDWKLVASNVV